MLVCCLDCCGFTELFIQRSSQVVEGFLSCDEFVAPTAPCSDGWTSHIYYIAKTTHLYTRSTSQSPNSPNLKITLVYRLASHSETPQTLVVDRGCQRTAVATHKATWHHVSSFHFNCWNRHHYH